VFLERVRGAAVLALEGGRAGGEGELRPAPRAGKRLYEGGGAFLRPCEGDVGRRNHLLGNRGRYRREKGLQLGHVARLRPLRHARLPDERVAGELARRDLALEGPEIVRSCLVLAD